MSRYSLDVFVRVQIFFLSLDLLFQLLNLTTVVRLEWDNCTNYIENNHPLALDDTTSEDSEEDYISTIDKIELTYIHVHQYLATKLKTAVYLHQKTFCK